MSSVIQGLPLFCWHLNNDSNTLKWWPYRAFYRCLSQHTGNLNLNYNSTDMQNYTRVSVDFMAGDVCKSLSTDMSVSMVTDVCPSLSNE